MIETLAALNQAVRRAKDPTEHRRIERSYRARYPERRLWRIARDRAAKKGIRFTISESDVVIPATCPVLGIPIVYAVGLQDGTATLDRIHASLGYTPGNVRVISHRANNLKSNMTLDECRMILRDLEERL